MSNGPASSRSQKKVLLWHPADHAHFVESLYYFLLAPVPYNRTVFREIAEGLRAIGIKGFCLYEVFGHYDLVLRVWLNQELVFEFHRYLETKLRSARNRPTSFAVQQAFHWSTGRRTSVPNGLQLLTPTRVRKAQNGDESEIERLRKDGAVVHYGPISDEGLIKFYVVVSQINPTEIVIEEALVYNILREIENFESTKDSPEVRRTSLYLGQGFGWALVKGLVRSIYDASYLVGRIEWHLTRFNMRTTTFIISDNEQEEWDFINESSLHLEGGPSPVMKHWLPEIFVDSKAAANWKKFERIALQVYDLFEKEMIDLSDQRFLADLLVSILKEDEPTAMNVLIYWFLELEAWLRANHINFLMSIGFEEPQETHSRLMQSCGMQEWGSVTLGDRLKYYVAATGTQEKGAVVAIPDWKRFTDLTGLRNNIAHGTFLGGKLLTNAEKILDEVVKFVPFYAALRRSVEKRF